MIEKIAIRNYRKFREFELEFSPGMNIVVDDTGKSTLVEAINLALTGRVNGRFLSSQEFSPAPLTAIRKSGQRLLTAFFHNEGLMGAQRNQPSAKKRTGAG